MNIFIVLFSVLAVANAGIYSSRWPADSQLPVRILRSDQIGQQGVDSTQYSFTSVSVQSESPNANLENSEDKNRSVVIPVQESDTEIKNVETLEIPEWTVQRSHQIEQEQTIETPASTQIQRNDETKLQNTDLPSQYSIIPESDGNVSPNTNFEEDIKEDSFRAVITPEQESYSQIKNVETLEIPYWTQVQRSNQIAQDIDSTHFITIGSIHDESIKTKSDETQYKPKRVRSVTLVKESESSIQANTLENVPASTVKTPYNLYYPNQPSNNYQSTHFEHPSVPAHNQYGPGGYPGHLDHHQSTISPVNNQHIYQNSLHSQQSAVAIAQNSPGYEFAAASASSNGLGGSAVSIANNIEGVQSALSSANSQGYGSAVAISENDRKQSTSIAHALNHNNGLQNNFASSISSPQFQNAASYIGRN